MTQQCYSVFNKTFTNQASHPSIVVGIYLTYVLLAIFGGLLNFVVIYAIWRNPLFHKPSYVLLGNLSLADFLVALLVNPLFAVTNVAALERSRVTFCETFVTGRLLGYWLGAVSLYTLALISIDRFLAIKIKKRYRAVVTLKRVLLVLLLGWVVLSIQFVVIATKLSSLPLSTATALALMFIFVSLATITVSYTMSFYYLRRLTKVSPTSCEFKTGENSDQTNNSFNVCKYRRSLKTMVIVFLTIIVFYSILFWCSVASLLLLKRHPQDFKVLKETYTILTTGETVVLFNSTINPLLYFWRMKDLFKTVKDIFKSTYRCSLRVELNENSVDLPQ